MVIRACRAVTGCVLYAVCVYVCVHVCVSVSKRLTAGCEEGQSQSGSYSNAHCPLATLPSLFLVRSRSLLRGVSMPLTVILTHSTLSLSPFFFAFHWLSAMMHLDTAHKLKPTHNCFHTFTDNWTWIPILQPFTDDSVRFMVFNAVPTRKDAH